MADRKPSDSDYATAHDVLEYELAKLERDEPYAVNSIAVFREALENLPWSADDG